MNKICAMFMRSITVIVISLTSYALFNGYASTLATGDVCFAQEAKQTPTWATRLKPLTIMPGVGLGEIKLGHSGEQVKEILGQPTSSINFSSGGVSLEYAYSNASFVSFGLDPGGSIEKITVADYSISIGDLMPHTKDSIGIGTPISKVFKTLGTPIYYNELQCRSIANPDLDCFDVMYSNGIFIGMSRPRNSSQEALVQLIGVEKLAPSRIVSLKSKSKVIPIHLDSASDQYVFRAVEGGSQLSNDDAKQVICNYWSRHFYAKVVSCSTDIIEKGRYNDKCGWAFRIKSTGKYTAGGHIYPFDEAATLYLKKDDFDEWNACDPHLNCGPFGCK